MWNLAFILIVYDTRRQMIAVKNLVKTVETPTHRVEILRDVSFEVPASEVVAIMGPSGSGKSTLLGMLAGLDWPTSGSVEVDGVEITRLDEDELAVVRGRKIGFVFQAYQLIPTLTAVENVLLPAEMVGAGDGGELGRAMGLLAAVGLEDRHDHYPTQLSGGEQQRVAVARAFMMEPSLLLADEPTGNLDSSNGSHVLDLLLGLNRERGTTLVLVTHDASLAALADRRISLKDGRIVEDTGSTE
jgi:putative ABC transport system ATP-binding protein